MKYKIHFLSTAKTETVEASSYTYDDNFATFYIYSQSHPYSQLNDAINVASYRTSDIKSIIQDTELTITEQREEKLKRLLNKDLHNRINNINIILLKDKLLKSFNENFKKLIRKKSK